MSLKPYALDIDITMICLSAEIPLMNEEIFTHNVNYIFFQKPLELRVHENGLSICLTLQIIFHATLMYNKLNTF